MADSAAETMKSNLWKFLMDEASKQVGTHEIEVCQKPTIIKKIMYQHSQNMCTDVVTWVTASIGQIKNQVHGIFLNSSGGCNGTEVCILHCRLYNDDWPLDAKASIGHLLEDGILYPDVKRSLEEGFSALEKLLNSTIVIDRGNDNHTDMLTDDFIQEMIIPDEFFQNMAAGCVVSLSHSGISSLPSSLFQLSNLRVLILRGCRKLSELPGSIGEFKMLEVMDLSYTRIRNLPKEMGQLDSLQKLGLRESKLMAIQFRLSRLRSLCELDLFNTFGKLDFGSSTDEELRYMHSIDGMSLRDIVNLESLTSLKIMVERFEAVNEEIITCLRRLKNFHLVIGLKFRTQKCDDFAEKNYDKVLFISCCLCNSVDGYGILTDLDCLIISTCRRLTTISSLVGPQQRLRDLRIENCDNVTEMIGHGNEGPLKNLENFRLVSLPLLEEELKLGENLKKVQINRCPKLKNLQNSLNQIRRVKELFIGDCQGIEAFYENQFAELEKLQFYCLPQMKNLGVFSNLKVLHVWRCPDFKSFPFRFQRLENLEELHVCDMCDVEKLIDCEIEEGVAVLPRIVDLKLRRLQNFTGIWEGKLLSGSLGNLGELNISDCPKLEKIFSSGFGRLAKLKKVRIDQCDRIEKIIEDTAMEDEGITLRSLERLELANVPRLSSIFTVKLGVGALENLVVLYLSHCSALKVVVPSCSHAQLPRLNHIYVGDCENVEQIIGGEQVLKNALPSLENVLISNLSRLQSIWKGELQEGSLTSLKLIDVTKCPELKHLLSLGLDKLQRLETIRVKDCDQLETVAEENPIKEFALPAIESIYLSNLEALKVVWRGGIEMGALQSLQNLKLCNCARLENLWDGELGNGVLSSLKSLRVWKCPELKILFPCNLRRLEILEEISVSDSGIEILTNETMEENALHRLKKLELDDLPRLGLLWMEGEIGDETLKELKRVSLRNCSMLTMLPFSLIRCPNLESLVVQDCATLETIVKEMDGNVFPTLANMNLQKLPNLKLISEKEVGITCLNNLEILTVTGIQGLKSFPPDFHMLRNLKQLGVKECDDMEVLISGGPWEGNALPNLKFLNIENLPKLKLIWEGMPGTVSMEHLKGLYVKGCKILSSLPFGMMKLEKLEQLHVTNCDEMETIFRKEGEQVTILPSTIVVKLENMPRLRRIWEGMADLPKLKYVSVIECPQLKNICFVTSSLVLEEISGRRDWWDALEFEGDVKSDLQKCYRSWPREVSEVPSRRIRMRPRLRL